VPTPIEEMLEALEHADAYATFAPWFRSGRVVGSKRLESGRVSALGRCHIDCADEHDAVLIELARNNLPALLALARLAVEARAVLDDYSEAGVLAMSGTAATWVCSFDAAAALHVSEGKPKGTQ